MFHHKEIYSCIQTCKLWIDFSVENNMHDNDIVCIIFGQLNRLNGFFQNRLISKSKLRILSLILFHPCEIEYFHKAEDHIYSSNVVLTGKAI